MTLVSKSKYIDKLDHIINQQNKTYHATINPNKAGIFNNNLSDFNITLYNC